MNSFLRLVLAIVFSLFFWEYSHSQIQIDSQSSSGNLREKIDYALENLSMSPVYSGILLQRTIPFFDPDLQGIKSASDSVFMNYGLHDIIYRNLYDARTLSSVLSTPERAYADDYNAYSQSNEVPLMLSALKYHIIDSLAFQDGRILIQNGQLNYGTSDQASVYLLDSIYTSALFSDILPLSTTFSLSSNMLIGNLDIDPLSVFIDPGDGIGYRQIRTGANLIVNFSYEGIYIIKIKFRSVGGQETTHYHKVVVSDQSGNTGSRGEPITFECPDDCFCEDIFDTETNTGINVSYRLACFDANGNRSKDITKIKRPLIILDGINLFWKGNQVNMDKLISDTDRGLSYRSMQVFGGMTLGEILDNNEYDVVFVDYHDHHTAIEKNAAAFQNLIRNINGIKASNNSTYKNIVIGISMGGVVSTYALRDMEINNENHDVSDFITFDSPIQGANMPIALQGLVENLNNFFDEFELLTVLDFLNVDLGTISKLKGIKKVLNSPAPRQMILYNIYDTTSHNNFYNTLRTMGPVENARTLAISNGSSIAATDIAPRSLILAVQNLRPYSGVGYENFLLNGLAILLKWGRILDLNVSLSAYTAPGLALNSNSNLLYNGRLEMYALFGTVDVNSILTVTGGNAIRAIDSAPGGIIGSDIIDAPINASNLLNYGIDLRIQNFCFIPTVSALNIQGVNADEMHSNLLTTNFSTTTYDAISTQMGMTPVFNNNNHVTMTFDNISALLGMAAVEGERLNNLLEGRTYNFGQSAPNDILQSGIYRPISTGHSITKDLTVRNNGNLWVNRNNKIGFIDNLTNRDNHKPSKFIVYLGEDICLGNPSKLTIGNGGKFIIGESSVQNEGEVYVKSQTELIIKNGGVLLIDDKSSVMVEANGVISLESGATLIIKGDGVLDIKRGGIFNIQAGVNIVLEKEMPDVVTFPFNPTTGSRILLNGNITLVGGEIELAGKGFIQFLRDYQLTSLTGSAAFKGHGKQYPSYRLDAPLTLAGLNVSIHNAYFSLGDKADIDFKGGNNKSFSTLGSLFENLNYASEHPNIQYYLENASDIKIDKATSVTLRTTDFSDVTCSIKKTPTVNGIRVHAKSFNKNVLFYLEDIAKVSFNNSSFKTEKPIYSILSSNPEIKKIGIDLVRVLELRLDKSEIDGFNAENGTREEAPILDYTGIRSLKSSYIYLNESKILNCKFGIRSQFDGINVILDKSEIANGSCGVWIKGSSTTGLVKMTCSTLKNFQVGISGSDITLAIDGLINSQNKGYIPGNKFLENEQHFSIPYFQKVIPEVIFARYNDWTDINTYNTLPCDLDQSEAGKGRCEDDIVYDCGSGAPIFPIKVNYVDDAMYNEFCPDETTCSGNDIMLSYWKSYNCFYNGNLEEAVNLLLPLGLDHYGMDNGEMKKYCKAILAEANAFAAGKYSYNPDSSAYGLDLDVLCGPITNGIQTKVIQLNDQNMTLSNPELIWSTEYPGEIFENNHSNVVTNGVGNYSLIVNNNDGCKYFEAIFLDSVQVNCDTLLADTIVYLTGPDFDHHIDIDSIVAHVTSSNPINPDTYVWEVYGSDIWGNYSWNYAVTTFDNVVYDSMLWVTWLNDSIRVSVYQGNNFIGTATKLFQQYLLRDNSGGGISSANDDLTLNKSFVQINPNPFNQSVNVIWESVENTIGEINVIDILGRSVYKKNVDISEGVNNIYLDDLAHLPSNLYTFILSSKNYTKSVRMIKH
jgi:hypothetical protein